MAHYTTDTVFKSSGIAAPLVFMSLFIVFVYGALVVGLMGIANTLVHTYDLTFFLERGTFGTVLAMCCLIAAWSLAVMSIAAVPYYILLRLKKDKTARTTAAAVIILMFHVFTMPVILWTMIRNSSPKLRARRVAKLRRKVLMRQAKLKNSRNTP